MISGAVATFRIAEKEGFEDTSEASEGRRAHFSHAAIGLFQSAFGFPELYREMSHSGEQAV
jgi:hypothetical protein